MQMAIDLPTISNTYYDGTCSPNPSSLTSNNLTGWGLPYDKWPQALKDQYSYNLTAAKQLLAAAGYPTGFKTNIVADSASDLDLLQIVKSYFAAVGIDMQIQTLDSSSWTSIVAIQHKVGQLAYRTTGSVGNSTEPIRQLSRLQPGQGSNWEMINDPVINAWFPTALAMSNVSDIKKYVSDANLYFAQQQYIISLVTPSNFAVYQPWLKGYNGQANSISGVTGPLHMSFYLARFWIDQKLKASMGF
jgi:ABC-type transport system substrate-binding protein